MIGKASIKRFEGRKKPWRVMWREAGKQRSKFFESEKLARAYCRHHNKALKDFGGVSREDQELLRYLKHRARELQISPRALIESAKRHSEDVVALPGIKEAITLQDALDLFLADAKRRNLRPASISSYKSLLAPMVARYPQRCAHELDKATVLRWITEAGTESTRASRYRNLKVLYTWLERRGFALPDQLKGLAWDKIKEDKAPITFFTPEQARAFIFAFPGYLQSGVALGLFAGIRPEEIVAKDRAKKRLAWPDIDFSARTIRVSSQVAKTREERILSDLPGNLWAWLDRGVNPLLQCRKGAQPGGAIVALTYTNWRRYVRKAAAASGFATYPQDIMRHSLATYGFYFGLEWVIATLGHSVDTKTYFRHYKGQGLKSQAEAYFAIEPAD